MILSLCGTMSRIIDILCRNNYTNTHLMNDLNHIKYEHDVCDNDEAYFEAYSYFNDGCDLNDCAHRKCVYSDYDNAYTMWLISRMHSYLIHSYDTHRFTLNEVHRFNDPNYDDVKQQNEMLNCMKRKKAVQQIHGVQRDEYAQTKNIVIDYRSLYFILRRNNISLQITQLRRAFGHYKNMDTLMSDIIDAYHAPNDTTLDLTNGIIIDAFQCDIAQRKRIYGIIIYKYFTRLNINNMNFIKLAQHIMTESAQFRDINQAQFADIAREHNVSGAMFIKGSMSFRSSLQFAQIFGAMHGYKKKHLSKIYARINAAYNINDSETTVNDIAINEANNS
eukprot:857174_1